MCLSCCDADKKANAKEGEFCIGKISFGDLVKDLIHEWQETGRTSFNILKEAVPDYPTDSITLRATSPSMESQDLKVAFV
jgi:hypothetical protein